MKLYLIFILVFVIVIFGMRQCDKKRETSCEISNAKYNLEVEESKLKVSSIIVKEPKKTIAISPFDISNKFISLQKQMEYEIIRQKYYEKKLLSDKIKQEEWKVRKIQLKALYLEYSNRWDEVENENDRYRMVLMMHDQPFEQKILEDLVDNARDIFVARNATKQLALGAEHESQSKELSPEESKKLFQKAIDYYERFEERLLGNNSFEDVYENLSENDCHALSLHYNTKGIAYQMIGDYDNSIDCFRKSALGFPSYDMFEKSQSEKRVARAYAVNEDQENVIKWLEKSIETHEKINDSEEQIIYSPFYQETLKELEQAKKGELMKTRWIH